MAENVFMHHEFKNCSYTDLKGSRRTDHAGIAKILNLSGRCIRLNILANQSEYIATNYANYDARKANLDHYESHKLIRTNRISGLAMCIVNIITLHCDTTKKMFPSSLLVILVFK